MENINVAILSAMPEEVGEILLHITNKEEFNFGDLTIYKGIFNESVPQVRRINVITAWSGWGKVSAARAITRILDSSITKKIDLIIFTGVAGAIDENLNQWDVIIPNVLKQYDMDASPLFERFVIPALNKSDLIPDKIIFNWANKVIKEFLGDSHNKVFKNLYNGVVATGDQFVSDKSVGDSLKVLIPDLRAVEMEGAAVAQVAEQENIPWLIIRVISDSADDKAPISFEDFLKIYNLNAWKILQVLLLNISYRNQLKKIN